MSNNPNSPARSQVVSRLASLAFFLSSATRRNIVQNWISQQLQYIYIKKKYKQQAPNLNRFAILFYQQARAKVELTCSGGRVDCSHEVSRDVYKNNSE